MYRMTSIYIQKRFTLITRYFNAHESGFLAEVFTQSFTMFTPDEGPGNLLVPPHALYAPIEKNQLPWSTVPSIKFEEPELYSKPLKL